jgi:DNA-binding transcriptional regulator YhcF (GntR family)
VVKVAVSKAEPLSLRLQLGEQLRNQIEDGTLAPGERLPNVRDLSADLAVNYNTVRRVYAELERQGYLEVTQGRGTFVARKPPRSRDHAVTIVRELVDDALARAVGAGISAAEFARMTYTRAKLFRSRRRKTRALFIECNDADLRDLGDEIRDALGIDPVRATTEQLQKKSRAWFDDFDLIATTFSHLAEVQKMAGATRRVVGVMVEPAYREVIADVADLPLDATIGLVCFRESGAEGMRRTLEGAGLERKFVVGSIDQPKKLARAFAADRVFLSGAYLDEVEQRPDLNGRMRRYEVHVSPASLRFLRSVITSPTD